MHIPDGYLSPQTFLPLYAVMVPIWTLAARKARRTLRTRQIPQLALGAAFSFVVMMINIPVPGGTSGHMVGGALLAILLGPWTACVSVSLALAIQALLFGDGGITAFAANSLTMAVVMPFVGYYSYRLIARGAPVSSRRQMVAGFVAGYLALNAAALYTAILLGLQPLIAAAPDGRPLYAPYSLAMALPAMALPHLLLFGIVEGVATALIIRYLRRADPACLSHGLGCATSAGTLQSLRYGVGVLALLSPLGIVLPWLFGAKSAWGEWTPRELERLIGFVPAGVERLGEVWRAPFPEYAFAGLAQGGLLLSSLAYLVSAALGIAAVVLCVRVCGRLMAMSEEK
jgi:cobalt/nickel transport system permease protein